MKIKCVITGLILIVFSCKVKENNSERIIVDIDNNTNIPEINIQSVISLESDSSSLIGDITSLNFYKNYIYIFDKEIANSIFLFNKEGKFINKTIRGKSPSELSAPTDFFLDTVNKVVYVWDSGSSQLKQYDLELNFLVSEQKDIVLNEFRKLNNDKWIVNSSYFDYYNDKNTKECFTYFIYNESLTKIIKKHIPINKNYINIEPYNSMTKKNRPLLCSAFDMNIYNINENNELNVAYKIDFKEYNISDDDKGKPDDYLFKQQDMGKLVANICGISENDKYLSFHYYFREKVDFVVYSKETSKIYLSDSFFSSKKLPYGSIKGIDNDTFILTTSVFDNNELLEFREKNKKLIKSQEKFNENPLIILFKINEE